MGLISGILRALFVRGGLESLGRTGVEVANALRPDATRQMQLGHEAFAATQGAYAAEFAQERQGRFDSFVNALNRLPRPLLALGTLGLFVYAMVDPPGFGLRMRGLNEVPEPLWWLLGAVVAFYFGAREAHHQRERRVSGPVSGQVPGPVPGTEPAADGEVRGRRTNPAIDAWRDAAGGDNGGRD